MKQILLTCPFTGADFTAYRYDDDSLMVIHPLTGEQLNFDKDHQGIFLDCKHIETLTPSQAALMLDVSKQRMSQIIANGTIPVKSVNNQPVFLTKDVMEYKETRKAGRPKKC